MTKLAAMSQEARDAIEAHIANTFGDELDELDPAERYQRLATERAMCAAIADRLGELAREELAAMEAAGMDRAAIGKAVGLTRQRVGQILGPRKTP